MKSHIPYLVAAVFATGAISIAAADTTDTHFVPEPTASASKTDGPDAQVAATIVNELNADPSLKDAKITVQPENGVVTLTGSARTEEQAKRASEIATALAGEGKVVNAIQADHLATYGVQPEPIAAPEPGTGSQPEPAPQ
jgi:Flp pilus assembly secretin CpaC